MKLINWLKTNQKYVTRGAAIALLVICYMQQKELVKLRENINIESIQGGDISKAQLIDSLQHLSDSLYGENYPCQIEKSRYETALQIFHRRNPKAAEEYSTIISNETE